MEKQEAQAIEVLIQTAYPAFNRRDIDGVLQCLSVEVEWANGWEGGFVQIVKMEIVNHR